MQALFASKRGGGDNGSHEPLAFSAAALMLYAAQLDGSIDDAEYRTVADLLETRFGLGPTEAKDLIASAGARAEAATDLYSLTRLIKDGFSAEQRTGIIEMLWEVVYSDGHVDPYESNLVRRIAGLLYVSDVESGAARKRVVGGLADR
ncbi:MAG: TerB family tellurite resistance protein [Rhodospirillales bacterium]